MILFNKKKDQVNELNSLYTDKLYHVLVFVFYYPLKIEENVPVFSFINVAKKINWQTMKFKIIVAIGSYSFPM